MYGFKMTAKDEKEEKPNLKIVIDNENMMDSSSILDENNNQEQITEDDAIEVEIDNNEIEFHVNLDKVPPTLQNTVLVKFF